MYNASNWIFPLARLMEPIPAVFRQRQSYSLGQTIQPPGLNPLPCDEERTVPHSPSALGATASLSIRRSRKLAPPEFPDGSSVDAFSSSWHLTNWLKDATGSSSSSSYDFSARSLFPNTNLTDPAANQRFFVCILPTSSQLPPWCKNWPTAKECGFPPDAAWWRCLNSDIQLDLKQSQKRFVTSRQQQSHWAVLKSYPPVIP